MMYMDSNFIEKQVDGFVSEIIKRLREFHDPVYDDLCDKWFNGVLKQKVANFKWSDGELEYKHYFIGIKVKVRFKVHDETLLDIWIVWYDFNKVVEGEALRIDFRKIINELRDE